MYTLNFTDEELRTIGALLSEHPYKIVAPILASINAQLQEKHHESRQQQVS
jgi:hypothetical protein